MVEKTSAARIEAINDPTPTSPEPGIRRLLSEMLDEMERNITVLIDRNAQLEKENQKLRFDNQRIREILGG
jgi:regulator of replication initiation timing